VTLFILSHATMFPLHFARSPPSASGDASPASLAPNIPIFSSLEIALGAGTKSWQVILVACGVENVTGRDERGWLCSGAQGAQP
jgi:hypothetical protein